MTDPVPTWIYNASGDSRVIDLAQGSPPPDGWSFSPQGELKPVAPAAASPSIYVPTVAAGEGSDPAPPAPPASDDRAPFLWDRMGALEARMNAVDEIIAKMRALVGQIAAAPEASDTLAPAPAQPKAEAALGGDEEVRAILAGMSREELETEAQTAGLRTDRRWSDDTLRAKLAEHVSQAAGQAEG